MIEHCVSKDGSTSTSFVSEVSPEMVRAFAALVEFAGRNFPGEGRLKHLDLVYIEPGGTVLVGGGTDSVGKNYKPGLYHVFDEAAWYGSGSIRDSSIEDANHLARFYGFDESKFLEVVRKFVDF